MRLRLIPLIGFALPSLLFAHPHVFIDTYFTIEMTPRHLHSASVTWIMDEMTSMSLLMDFDSDHNEKFDPAETEALKADAFDHLQDQGYYLRLELDKKVLAPVPGRFWLEVADHRVLYHFTVPMDYALDSVKTIRFGCVDPEYLVAMLLQQDRIRVTDPQNPKRVIPYRVIQEEIDYTTMAELVEIEVHP